MDCAVIGDSIGVGIAQASGCKNMAQVGRRSSQQLALIKRINADVVVISLGSNDPTDPNLYRNLRRVRSSIDARRVVWILPYNGYAREAAIRIALDHRDGTVNLRNFVSKDNVHPLNYRNVARAALNGGEP